jgi:DNA-binding MarR family transcriptional regulator
MTRNSAAQTSPTNEYEAVAQFRSTLRRFQHVSDEVARRHGLTARRYELLVMIAGAPTDRPASTSDVAKRMYVELHTATELVARAEQAGLVRRTTDTQDRRISRLALTEDGRRRLDATIEALRPERERLTELLADIHRQAAALAES